MLQCARHEGEMRFLVNGEPQRAHLQGAAERARTAGRPIPSLEQTLAGPPLPEGGEYLWTWLMELDRSRTFNGMSGAPEPITYLQVDAWARLTGREPEPCEVEALFQLDAALRAGWVTGGQQPEAS